MNGPQRLAFSYDKDADAIALTIGDGPVVRDVAAVPNVFIGYDKDGSIVEIQIVDLSKMKISSANSAKHKRKKSQNK